MAGVRELIPSLQRAVEGALDDTQKYMLERLDEIGNALSRLGTESKRMIPAKSAVTHTYVLTFKGHDSEKLILMDTKLMRLGGFNSSRHDTKDGITDSEYTLSLALTEADWKRIASEVGLELVNVDYAF